MALPILSRREPAAPLPNGKIHPLPGLSDKEIKRRRKILLGSKSGVLIATMLLALIETRKQIRAGKIPLGMTPGQLDDFLTELLTGFVHLRDSYVEEKTVSAAAEAQKSAQPTAGAAEPQPGR